MDSARLDSIEYRLSKLEVASKESPPKKKEHQKFICPSDINPDVLSQLVEVRKKLFSESHNTGLNLVFNGNKLCSIIRTNCSTLDDLRKISGLGEKNIVEFGNRFLEVLKPEPQEVIIEPEVETVPVPVPIPVESKKAKAKAKPKTNSIQIYP